MRHYRPIIPELAPIVRTSAVSAWLMGERHRAKEESGRKASLEDWEDEGGSIAAAGDVSSRPPSDEGGDPGQDSPSIDAEEVAPSVSSRVSAGRRDAAELTNAAIVAGSGRRDSAGELSDGPACPRCKSSLVCRVRRRWVDRLISCFVPVLRYRCCSMGCDWEGNLREREYFVSEPAPE